MDTKWNAMAYIPLALTLKERRTRDDHADANKSLCLGASRDAGLEMGLT